MSSRASQWPCPQPPTTASTRWRLAKRSTALGHRRRTGPGLRTMLHADRRKEQPGGHSSSSCLRRSPAWGPEAFTEHRPQERVQRHTVERLADLVRIAPMVPILDAPVPQMVDNVHDGFSTSGQPDCMLSTCPRSQKPQSSSVWLTGTCVFRRWRNSLWKCRSLRCFAPAECRADR